MTDENKAWEQFSKADENSTYTDASAQGMLQAIMAELNSVKADTAKLAANGTAAPPAETDADAQMGAEPPMPPVDMGGDMAAAPPAEEGAGAMPPAEPPGEGGEAPPMGAPAEAPAGAGGGLLDSISDDDFMNLLGGSELGSPVGPAPPAELPQIPGAEGEAGAVDPTLSALQEALSKAQDPKVISDLAGMIQNYVGGGEAEAVAAEEAAATEEPGAIPEEALVEALVQAAAEGEVPEEVAGGEAPIEDGAAPIDELAAIAAMQKSETNPEPGMPDAGAPPVMASDDEPEEKEEAEEAIEDDGPADIELTIKIFLDKSMSDVLGENAEKGLSDKNPSTESFKVCEPTTKSCNIDDAMNVRLREKSGVDGKKYQVKKSASELQNEKHEEIRKSVASFDAVKGLRVGDVLMAMWGLRQLGDTKIEKSYAPLIDEIVKNCDNTLNPLFTEPLLRSYDIDISQIYEPVDMEGFKKGVNPVASRIAGRLAKEGLKVGAKPGMDAAMSKAAMDLAREMIYYAGIAGAGSKYGDAAEYLPIGDLIKANAEEIARSRKGDGYTGGYDPEDYDAAIQNFGKNLVSDAGGYIYSRDHPIGVDAEQGWTPQGLKYLVQALIGEGATAPQSMVSTGSGYNAGEVGGNAVIGRVLQNMLGSNMPDIDTPNLYGGMAGVNRLMDKAIFDKAFDYMYNLEGDAGDAFRQHVTDATGSPSLGGRTGTDITNGFLQEQPRLYRDFSTRVSNPAVPFSQSKMVPFTEMSDNLSNMFMTDPQELIAKLHEAYPTDSKAALSAALKYLKQIPGLYKNTKGQTLQDLFSEVRSDENLRGSAILKDLYNIGKGDLGGFYMQKYMDSNGAFPAFIQDMIDNGLVELYEDQLGSQSLRVPNKGLYTLYNSIPTDVRHAVVGSVRDVDSTGNIPDLDARAMEERKGKFGEALRLGNYSQGDGVSLAPADLNNVARNINKEKAASDMLFKGKDRATKRVDHLEALRGNFNDFQPSGDEAEDSAVLRERLYGGTESGGDGGSL